MVNDAAQFGRIERYPLERVAAPTLVVHAVDDVLAPLSHGQFTAETVPNARLLVLESGGHLWLGQRGRMAGAVVGFL